VSQNKVISFIIGLGLTIAVFTVIALFLGRADKISGPETAQGVITESDLKGVKTKTNGLENFGNLPIVVTSDEIGRDNPFDPY